MLRRLRNRTIYRDPVQQPSSEAEGDVDEAPTNNSIKITSGRKTKQASSASASSSSEEEEDPKTAAPQELAAPRPPVASALTTAAEPELLSRVEALESLVKQKPDAAGLKEVIKGHMQGDLGELQHRIQALELLVKTREADAKAELDEYKKHAKKSMEKGLKDMKEMLQNGLQDMQTRFPSVEDYTRFVQQTRTQFDTEHNRMRNILKDVVSDIKTQAQDNEGRIQNLLQDGKRQLQQQTSLAQKEKAQSQHLVQDVSKLAESMGKSVFWSFGYPASAEKPATPPSDTTPTPAADAGTRKKPATRKTAGNAPETTAAGPATRTRSRANGSKFPVLADNMSDALMAMATMRRQAIQTDVPSVSRKEHAEDLEPCPDQCEEFHQLLMYIIHHLQSKILQTHEELDEVVVTLSDMAMLEYPSSVMIPVVSDRQATILRLISSFYQIVCLISMDKKLSPEEVYADKELMLQASHRVLAMH